MASDGRSGVIHRKIEVNGKLIWALANAAPPTPLTPRARREHIAPETSRPFNSAILRSCGRRVQITWEFHHACARIGQHCPLRARG
jgi:hypothetical protein